MNQIKVAIIGVGRIGRLHAENLVKRIKNVKVEAVADINQEAAARCAQELGISKFFQYSAPVFADPSIEAVLICTPTASHGELIIEAARAGKHIFCEKPLALTLEEIDQALAAVEKSRVKFMVGFNRRFDPNFAKVRELIVKGAIGKPHLLRITSRDPALPPLAYLRQSGGIFIDMTIHDFDLARFLMGEEVVEIYATGSILIDPVLTELGDIDTAVTVLHFASGAIGVIDNSRRAVYGYDQRIEVFGERGMISVGNPAADTSLLLTEKGLEGPTLPYFFIERYTDSYIKELEAFLDAIRENREPPVTGKDARISVVMAYAANRSLKEKTPVRLKEIESFP